MKHNFNKFYECFAILNFNFPIPLSSSNPYYSLRPKLFAAFPFDMRFKKVVFK